MSMSKTYPVKSNAARAAKPYGLTRTDLVQVDGGWAFDIPNTGLPVPASAPVAAPISQATEISQPASEPEAAAAGLSVTDPSHPDYDARSLHTVEHSKHGNDGSATKAEPAEQQESNVKTKTKGRKAAKGPKVAKPAKATKPAKAAKTGRTRAANGIGAKVVAACKARWTPIADLIKMTGWEPHTTRAYISVQSRKLGLTAERRKTESGSEYRMVTA